MVAGGDKPLTEIDPEIEDPDFWRKNIKKIQDLMLNQQERDRVLGKLEKACSGMMAAQLVDYQYYSFLRVVRPEDFYSVIQRMLNIISKNKEIDYERTIRILVSLQDVDRFWVCEVLGKLLKDNKTFSDKFVTDTYYRPFFKPNFWNIFIPMAKNYLTLNLENISSTQMFPSSIDSDIAQIYNFPNDPSPEEKSIITVAHVLSNKEFVFRALKKLEAELVKRKEELTASGKNFTVTQDWNKKKYKDNKLLSGFLYKWAKENGFTGYARVLKETDARSMLAMFSRGYLYKDNAFRGPLHGEWIHFLQWYILTEVQKEQGLMDVSPVDLLRWIGGHQQGQTLWDKTFEGDQVENKSALYQPDFDARKFNKFNQFLLGEECKNEFPILHESIYHRESKVDPPKNRGNAFGETIDYHPFNEESQKNTRKPS